jgi:hypothetical protein
MQLGDHVHDALAAVGVTPERVARWLGGTCGGCDERRQRLNALGAWAARWAAGKREKAREWLDQILGD